MSKLNKKGISARTKQPTAVSYNGNLQFSHNDSFQLYDLVVSHFFGKDSFYEGNDTRLIRLTELVNKCVAGDKLDFIANVASIARHEMNMRTMPLVLVVLFAKALRDQNKSFSGLRVLVADVIARADQITDMYSYALEVFETKNKMPLAIKRGVADAFNKFNAYHFGKYNSNNKVKFKDLLRIVHPTAKNESQGKIFQDIMKDTLETPDTWETKLSANGQLPVNERKSNSKLWDELVTSGKLGYFALLRNLRNMWDAPISNETKKLVYKRLADEKEVAKSKLFPFRFTTALEVTQQFSDSKLHTAISKAIDGSLGNLPEIGKNPWIIIDCSGSMRGKPIQAACLFAAALLKSCKDSDNVKVTMFSDDAKHVAANTEDSVLSIAKTFENKVIGAGTNLQSALALKSKLGFEPDTVIVLSDMQVNSLTGGSIYNWQSRSYNATNVGNIFTKDCVKIAFNLSAYDSTPLAEIDGWYQLGGWSDKVFEFIPAMRNKESIVKVLSKPYQPFNNKTLKKVEKDEEVAE